MSGGTGKASPSLLWPCRHAHLSAFQAITAKSAASERRNRRHRCGRCGRATTCTHTSTHTRPPSLALLAAVQKSHRQSLRAQLARKLHPNYLEAFRDVDIDQLISIGCVNLHVLALLSAEDLSNAGLPIGPICVLQAAGLIGKHHIRTPSGQPWAVKCFKTTWISIGCDSHQMTLPYVQSRWLWREAIRCASQTPLHVAQATNSPLPPRHTHTARCAHRMYPEREAVRNCESADTLRGA